MLLEEVIHLDLDGLLVVVHVGEVGGVIVLGQGSQLILFIERIHNNSNIQCSLDNC